MSWCSELPLDYSLILYKFYANITPHIREFTHIQLTFGIIILHAWVQVAISQHGAAIAKAVQELGKLLDADVSPKGDVFPQITGPNLQDHVCIVGAGPAGIHMALSLKDRGYKDVTIFEKTNRVGGKIKDVKFDGYYQWQGAIFLTADYFDNIVELAKRYNVGEIHPTLTAGVSTTHSMCITMKNVLFYFVCYHLIFK